MKMKIISLSSVLSCILAFGIVCNVQAASEGSKASSAMGIATAAMSIGAALDGVCPNKELVCAAWDVVNAKITPLPVTDMTSMVGLTMDDVEQTVETVQAGYQLVEKIKKLKKWSKSGANLKKSLSQIKVKNWEDCTSGAETAVDAFKGVVSAGKSLGVIDFTKDKAVAKAVETMAVVSNPVGSSERLSEQEKKDAFIQQSVLDVVARTLYYKNELEELRKTDTDIQSASGSGDSVGTTDVSMRVKDANQRIQSLQEKILATRLEIQGIKNLKMANPVQEKISVSK